MSEGWNVCYVKSQQEFLVERELGEHGVEAYAPRRKVLRRPRHAKMRPGKLIEVSVPLYARYVFFKPVSEDDMIYIWGHKGIIGIVRVGGALATMRDKDMFKLRAIIEKGLFDEDYVQTEPTYIPMAGEQLVVTDGMFLGAKAIFQRAAGEKACVVVTSQGKTFNARLPWNHVGRI